LSNQDDSLIIPTEAVKAVDNGVRISLRIQPGAKRSALAGPYGNTAWKLAIQAPPVDGKANEAVQKVGRTNGLVYIFDISMGTIPFVNETLSVDVTPMVKAELNISPSKKLPAPQGM
jgi:uncharacterized protein YggU (UPF0235/DUF167 family)